MVWEKVEGGRDSWCVRAGTKEAAFLQALSQLVLAQAVARLCAQSSSVCRCENTPILHEKNESAIAADRRDRADWERRGWPTPPAPHGPVCPPLSLPLSPSRPVPRPVPPSPERSPHSQPAESLNRRLEEL